MYSLKPANVSPLIKGMRWSFLAFGVGYGVIKLEAYKSYEDAAAPKRHQHIVEKYERIKKKTFLRDTKDLYEVAKEFEITDFPPGWNDGV